MKRHLVTAAFFLLAMACYAFGAAGPATGLVVVGILAEGTGWFRLFRGKGER